jgi:hypothetical protein
LANTGIPNRAVKTILNTAAPRKTVEVLVVDKGASPASDKVAEDNIQKAEITNRRRVKASKPIGNFIATSKCARSFRV